LETRLEAMPRIALEEPDEALLKAVIVRLFERRQWRAQAEVAAFAAPRISRTFAAARAFVDAAGAEAIASGRQITIPLARKVLESLSEVDSGD
jgi:chromosomal replication initiation ATPase DnaA